MPSKSKRQHNFMEAVAHNKAFAKKVGVPQSVGEDFAKADKGKHFKKGGINMATKKRINPAMAMMAARAMPTPAPAPMAPPQGAMAGGMKHGGLSKEHHKHLAHHHLAMAEHHMAQHEGHHTKKMAKGGHAHAEKEHEMHQAKELRKLAKEEEHEAKGMRHGGKAHMKKYAMGGAIKREASTEPRGHMKEKETMGPRNMKKDVEAGSNKHGKFGESKDQKRGHTRGHNLGDSGKREPIETEKNMKSFMKKMASGGSTSSRADGIAKRGHTKTKYC